MVFPQPENNWSVGRDLEVGDQPSILIEESLKPASNGFWHPSSVVGAGVTAYSS